MRDRIQRCGYSTYFKTKYRHIFEGSGLMDLVFFYEKLQKVANCCRNHPSGCVCCVSVAIVALSPIL